MKVLIDSGPSYGEHIVRGIGFHTNELYKALEKLSDTDFQVSLGSYLDSPSGTYDIVHFPYFQPYFSQLPSRMPPKSVVTVHDLIPLIYPKQYSSGLRGKLRFREQKGRLAQADAILTISETSKKDICRFLGVTPGKVKVVYLAPREMFKKKPDKKVLSDVKRKYSLPSNFILYVGDVNYNKNILALIKASKKISVPLVIVGKHAVEIDETSDGLPAIYGPKDWIRFVRGKRHPELAHLLEVKKELDSGRNIYRLGFLPDDELVSVYSLASVYCQPSLYEGFGLPVLDAFASGVPTIVSKTQALVEISDGGAFVSKSTDYIDLAQAITTVLEDKKLQEQLKASAKKVVSQYSWEKTAKETLALYKSIL